MSSVWNYPNRDQPSEQDLLVHNMIYSILDERLPEMEKPPQTLASTRNTEISTDLAVLTSAISNLILQIEDDKKQTQIMPYMEVSAEQDLYKQVQMNPHAQQEPFPAGMQNTNDFHQRFDTPVHMSVEPIDSVQQLPVPRDAKLTYCTFCKRNKEPKHIYESHLLHVGGLKTCPALKECFCEGCGRKGHTMSHCFKKVHRESNGYTIKKPPPQRPHPYQRNDVFSNANAFQQ